MRWADCGIKGARRGEQCGRQSWSAGCGDGGGWFGGRRSNRRCIRDTRHVVANVGVGLLHLVSLGGGQIHILVLSRVGRIGGVVGCDCRFLGFEQNIAGTLRGGGGRSSPKKPAATKLELRAF